MMTAPKSEGGGQKIYFPILVSWEYTVSDKSYRITESAGIYKSNEDAAKVAPGSDLFT